MGYRRPLVIKLTGIPAVSEPAFYVRYDGTADILYRSLGAGLWKAYDVARAIFVKATTGGLVLAATAAKTIGFTRVTSGVGTLGGTAAKTISLASAAAGGAEIAGAAAALYIPLFAKATSGGAAIAGAATTSEEDA